MRTRPKAWIFLFLMVTVAESQNICTPSVAGVQCNMTSYNENNSTAIDKDAGIWNSRPQNIRFHYFIESSNDADLVVRGVVKWKVNLRDWQEQTDPVRGFRISIYELSTGDVLQVKNYDLSVEPSFEDIAEEHKVSFLPLKEQGQASAFVSIMNDVKISDCSLVKGLAKFWAPRMDLNITDVDGSVTTTARLAPSRLCIASYELFLEKKDGGVTKKAVVKVTPGQKFFTYTFTDLERSQPYIVKLVARNSTLGDCACFGCNCITEKSKVFEVDELIEKVIDYTDEPSDLNRRHESVLVTWVAFGLAFVIVFLATVAICVLCPSVGKKLRDKHTLMKSIVPFWKTGKRLRSQKVFVVSAPAHGEEYKQAQRIINTLRESHHEVKCEDFEKVLMEENLLQWISAAFNFAEKIVLLHSKETVRGLGVYDIVTALLSPTDKRVSHVKLSPVAKNPMMTENQYELPRDEKLFEKSFEVILTPLKTDEEEQKPLSSPPTPSPVPIPCTPSPAPPPPPPEDEIIISLENEHLISEEETEEHPHSGDSGVSLLSSKKSMNSTTGCSFSIRPEFDEETRRIRFSDLRETQFLM